MGQVIFEEMRDMVLETSVYSDIHNSQQNQIEIKSILNTCEKEVRNALEKNHIIL